MRNFHSNGKTIEVVVGVGESIEAGQLVKVGDVFGVAVNSGAEGETVVCNVTGVYSVPKAAGAVTQGAPLYYVVADSEVSTDDNAGANALVGYAWEAALNADAEVL